MNTNTVTKLIISSSSSNTTVEQSSEVDLVGDGLVCDTVRKQAVQVTTLSTAR